METNEEIKQIWSIFEWPDFINKYLALPELIRLKGIGYFCGADYSSPEYNTIRYFVSRYDHSITCALFTWNKTHDKLKTIAALLHDIASPCFSHVIDYMNKDFIEQESTEAYTFSIIKNNPKFNEYFAIDNTNIKEIENILNDSVVNNKRPKLCVDRLDGIITPCLVWLNAIDVNLAKKLFKDCHVFGDELGYKNVLSTYYIQIFSDLVNEATHSPVDNAFMQLLAKITKLLITNNYITEEYLYTHTEPELIEIIKQASIENNEINELWLEYTTTTTLPSYEKVKIKNRYLNVKFNNSRIIPEKRV